MDSAIAKQLVDKIYEKRKAAALDLEKLIRECHLQGDQRRIHTIIEQLVDMFSNSANPLHLRNGGLIGLAGTAIALGVDIAPYMDKFVTPLLDCFVDAENRIRYFSAECLYNIAKVSKGEILVYFNDIFDALSKLAADSELSVKNGAELLDRLLKDIVAETASVYVPQYPETEKIRDLRDNADPLLAPNSNYLPTSNGNSNGGGGILFSYQDPLGVSRAFSLAHFIPLLRERIYVVSPFTRSYLVSWITVLDSVPELELVTFLPEFLDGLLKYLSDPTEDVRVATEVLLAEFLREIRDITIVRKRADKAKALKRSLGDESAVGAEQPSSLSQSLSQSQSQSQGQGQLQISTDLPTSEEKHAFLDSRSLLQTDYFTEEGEDVDYRDTGAWLPGQSVKLDYGAIIEILIEQLEPEHDEIQHSTALRWLSEFLTFAPEFMVPFTPRLIPAILPNLAHHAPMIQTAALRTNKLLLGVVQGLPAPAEPKDNNREAAAASSKSPPSEREVVKSPTNEGRGESPTRSRDREKRLSRQSQLQPQSKIEPQPQPKTEPQPQPPLQPKADVEQGTYGGMNRSTETLDPAGLLRSRGSGLDMSRPADLGLGAGGGAGVGAGVVSTGGGGAGAVSRPGSPSVSVASGSGELPARERERERGVDGRENNKEKEREREGEASTAGDLLDYQMTVNELTVQFLSEFEETRVAALKWLIMLHQKAPKKILAMDDGTFPALLKTLSDSSEEVIKHDLQLLAQISSSSEESYFKAFMMNLLELFSTDRRLLDTRGSLIIRQLCMNLNTERIYRTFAEILEKEDDLEFASDIVQKLHIIMVTSPELADFRKRLKNLETRQDGQALFTTLYRSWCHNAVSVFSLCLLAQAYEHASNLLYIFADLEITVQMLVQIDKLVQLIESPVFTYLRLQLLEPDRHPHLFKCLYGILMLLPQSLAFVSLRNRLNAVNSAGFLHIAPKPSSTTASHRSPSPMSTRSKMGREDIKWQELLQHFRFVQARHEKARRQAMGTDVGRGSMLGSDEDATRGGVFDTNGEQTSGQTGPGVSASASRFGVGGSASPGGGGSRPHMRRRVTGESSASVSAPVASGSGSGGTNLIPRSVLSPLNPRARTQHGFFGNMSQAVTGGPGSGGGQEKAMSPTTNAKSLPPVEKATALQHLKRTTPGPGVQPANVRRG